jgi:hypothetical protein
MRYYYGGQINFKQPQEEIELKNEANNGGFVVAA